MSNKVNGASAQTMASADGRTLTSKLSGSGEQSRGELRFIRAKELKEAGTLGLIVEGIYEGPLANDMTGKNDFKVREANGNLAILNSTASLSNQMSDLDIGSYVAIQYNGTTVIKSGPRKGKEAHQFNVFAE